MIDKPIIFNFFNYGEPFLGSYHGMRFCIERIGEKPNFKFKITHWPEPFCIEKTLQEKKESCEFTFSQEGYEEGLDWLNKKYKEYKI